MRRFVRPAIAAGTGLFFYRLGATPGLNYDPDTRKKVKIGAQCAGLAAVLAIGPIRITRRIVGL